MTTFRDILDAGLLARGETTPAMELTDEYRQQLVRLASLLGNEGSSGAEILEVSKKLNNLQSQFGLEHLLTTGPLERLPMASLVKETITLLTQSPVDFPNKQKILANSISREQIIRAGKEP